MRYLSPTLKVALADADGAQHFPVSSLHLSRRCSADCGTLSAGFVIEGNSPGSVSLHAAALEFWPNHMHLFGLQGVTASSEISLLHTNRSQP